MGRIQVTDNAKLRVGFPGVSIRLAFEGSGAILQATCEFADCFVATTVDGVWQGNQRLSPGEDRLVLASELALGHHQIELVRQTETWLGVMVPTVHPLPRRLEQCAPHR